MLSEAHHRPGKALNLIVVIIAHVYAYAYCVRLQSAVIPAAGRVDGVSCA